MKVRVLLLLITGGLAVALHMLLHFGTYSLVPLPIFLALVWWWLIPSPWYFVISLALLSELFTTLPVGIMFLAVVMPGVFWKLRGRIDIDLSFSFLLMIFASTCVQIMLFQVPALRTYLAQGNVALSHAVPWLAMCLAIIATTLCASVTCIVLSNYLTYEHPLR